MPKGDRLKQLFRNYQHSDHPGFEAVAQPSIAKERQANHPVLTNDLVITEVRRAELLETYGVRPKSRLLFCGPLGCGKTLTAEASKWLVLDLKNYHTSLMCGMIKIETV